MQRCLQRCDENQQTHDDGKATGQQHGTRHHILDDADLGVMLGGDPIGQSLDCSIDQLEYQYHGRNKHDNQQLDF